MRKNKLSKSKKIKNVVKKEIKVLKNSVTKLLDTAKVKYNLIEHRVVYTAHDVSATTKNKLGEIAKVVLLKVNGLEDTLPKTLPKNSRSSGRVSSSFVLVVLPVGKYVDFSGIKKVLKAKKVSMANEKDIIKHLKTKVGLLHPFGSQYNMQTLLDKGLAKSKKLMASAGSYTHTLEMTMKDFEKLTTPIKGAFAKAKR